jgi:hypothetical protein
MDQKFHGDDEKTQEYQFQLSSALGAVPAEKKCTDRRTDGRHNDISSANFLKMCSKNRIFIRFWSKIYFFYQEKVKIWIQNILSFCVFLHFPTFISRVSRPEHFKHNFS